MENKNRAYNRRVMEEIGIGSLAIEQIFKEMDKRQPMFTKNIFTKVDEGILNRKLNFSQYEEGSENYRFNYYHTALVNKDTGFLKETLVYINKSNNLRQDELIKLLNGGAIERDICGRDGVYCGWQAIDTEEDKYGYPILRSYNENFGYDLGAIFSKCKLMEMGDERWRKDAEQKMRNGESVLASAEIDGKIVPVIIRPFVRFKTLHFTHLNGVELTKDQRLQILAPVEKKQDHKQDQGLEENESKKSSKSSDKSQEVGR